MCVQEIKLEALCFRGMEIGHELDSRESSLPCPGQGHGQGPRDSPLPAHGDEVGFLLQGQPCGRAIRQLHVEAFCGGGEGHSNQDVVPAISARVEGPDC